MRYRRAKIKDGTYFFTVNLADRSSALLTEKIDALRSAFQKIKLRHPFKIEAMVVLPDHLHAIWTLPPDDDDYATRWALIKATFSRQIPENEKRNSSRLSKGERGIWQRRYWEHLIRDELDLNRHVDYIHYNPVKHGHARSPIDWGYSSIHRYIAKGTLPPDWGFGCRLREYGFWRELTLGFASSPQPTFTSRGRNMSQDLWYRFENEERKRIIESAACEQHTNPGQVPMVQLSESDPRVQEYLGPPWARTTFQRINIETIEDLIGACRICSTNPRFGYRGESDYDRTLTTCIERDRDKTIIQQIGLWHYEQRILLEAKRRAHHYIQDIPDSADIMGWLALLRHFGVPTRMLDITWSLFIAAYFAVHKKNNKDGCIWAFNQFLMRNNLHALIMHNTKTLFVDRERGALLDNYQSPTQVFNAPVERRITWSDIMSGHGPDINLLFELALYESLSIEGLIIVEPQWLSKRMDVQQGAFLVPLSLRTGFMSNLYKIGNISDDNSEEKSVSDVLKNKRALSAIKNNASVIKFRIKSSIKDEMREFLKSANIHRLVLFPDSEGFFGHLSDLIPSGQIFKD